MTERERDELILAKIIAGALGDGRPVAAGNWGVEVASISQPEPSGPVCAIGAGLLFAGIRKVHPVHSGIYVGPIGAFALALDVDWYYAAAISHGFEEASNGVDNSNYETCTDRRAGYLVGQAAYAALVEDQENK